MQSFNDQTNPPPVGDPLVILRHEMHEAEVKAWDSLSRYKFQMFGNCRTLRIYGLPAQETISQK
jgi:hypothetical protein